LFLWCQCQLLFYGALQERKGADFVTLATRQSTGCAGTKAARRVMECGFGGDYEKSGEEHPVQDRVLPEFWPEPKLLRP
jgi:hypothetical protein